MAMMFNCKIGNASPSIQLIWRRKGIGSSIMLRLMESARNRGYRTMEGLVLTENRPMMDLARHLGFRVEASDDGPDVRSVVKML